MFNHPRRPYYRYSNETSSNDHTKQGSEGNTIENKRFWKLWRELKSRRAEAAKERKATSK